MISWLQIDVIACYALFGNRIWNISIDACSWWKLGKVLNLIFSQYLYFIHIYTCAATVTITKTSHTTNCYYDGADPQLECLLKFECFRDLSVWALPSSLTNMYIVRYCIRFIYVLLFILIPAVPTTPELVKQTSAPVRASLPAAHASQAMITSEQQHVS